MFGLRFRRYANEVRLAIVAWYSLSDDFPLELADLCRKVWHRLLAYSECGTSWSSVSDYVAAVRWKIPKLEFSAGLYGDSVPHLKCSGSMPDFAADFE